MDYDIIGDIHGQAEKLEALLQKMGYRSTNGAWQHPQRKAIFVGDFVDLGQRGVESVQTVRAMVDAGSALAVMGNHELNAIAWHTEDARMPGEYLRRRHTEPWGEKNRKQHQAFLDQVERDPALHKEIIDWFLTLPLWLDEDELRVVHACWHEPFMDWLSPRLHDGRYLTRDLMVAATDEPEDPADEDKAEASVFLAVEALTKGIEIQLPAGESFIDKHGITRNRVRASWWESYPVDGKPVFFGHYWMTGAPALQARSAVCVDYSAGKGGQLAAYRWESGAPLSVANFIQAG